MSPSPEDLALTIQQSLQSLAEQIGEPITPETAMQLYQEARDLLNHLSYEPITLARVAGTLLVYQLTQSGTAELDWLKEQIQASSEVEEVRS